MLGRDQVCGYIRSVGRKAGSVMCLLHIEGFKYGQGRYVAGASIECK